MARASNETLAKAVSNAVFDLQAELKKDQRERKRILEETDKHAERIEQATSHFEPDLSGLKDSMRNYIDAIDKSAEKVNSSAFTWKTITIYFGFLVIVVGAFYFLFQHQVKEVQKARKESQLYERFILEDKSRTADFEKWVNSAD